MNKTDIKPFRPYITAEQILAFRSEHPNCHPDELAQAIGYKCRNSLWQAENAERRAEQRAAQRERIKEYLQEQENL